MHFQQRVIDRQRSKALKVLTETKKKLEHTVKFARDFIATNKNEIALKLAEVDQIHSVNADLESSVQQMEASITETNKILNPGA